MTRRNAIIVAVFVVAEGLMLWTHQAEGFALARWTYQTLWRITPRPAGMENYQPPDRFSDR